MENKKFASLSEKEFYIEYIAESKPVSMQNYHYHNSYEIYYLCEGERYYFIKDKCYKIKKGNLVFINKYDIHYTTSFSNQGYERFVMNFKKEFLEELLNVSDIDLFACFDEDINIVEFNLQQQQLIESVLRTMLLEFESDSAGRKSYLKTALVQMLIIINRYNSKTNEDNPSYMNSTHKTISEITGYVNNNFAEEISLKSVADKFFISTYHFSRTFKKVTGLSFIDYLNSVRIKEAQKLLSKTKMNITETGEAVGFKSTTHFGRVFKNITGMSPMEYKKSIKYFK